jgi:catecholate siderophore receptor
MEKHMKQHPQSIRSRKHSTLVPAKFNKSLLALATLALSFSVQAQQATTQQPTTEKVLPEVKVKAEADVPFKADTSANTKLTQPLLDTPQTVQVIKKEILLEQGSASLMEALRNTPGITMQLGENGNTSAGDTFSMRGFSVSSSTFVDGIRDLGAVTRDVFNLEQIEIVKGPAGADVGRGAASGYLNLISKLPTRNAATSTTLGYGSADRKRATLDTGTNVGETGALRFNALFADGDVPKRDEVSNQNYAIAPSIAFGLGTPTRFYLFSQHVKQDNVPDAGIAALGYGDFNVLPYYDTTNTTTNVTTRTDNAATRSLAAAIMAAPKPDRANYYGYNGDSEQVTANMITSKFEHDLDAKTVVRNVSRYGKTDMDRTLSGVSSPAVSAATTTIGNVAYLDPNNPAAWTFTGNRQSIDQTNEILANQTSFNTAFTQGQVSHTLTGGLEIMYERQKSLNFGTAAATINTIAFPATVNPPVKFYNPDTSIVRGQPYATGAYTDGDTTTTALYAMDTVELDPQWQLSGGLRYEHYTTNSNVVSVVTNVLTPVALKDTDNLLSWKVGALYKPVSNGSIYASYATSQTPPGGANFALSATANNQNNAALDPQETDNIEVGTKWALLNDQLTLSAALFSTENSKQASFDDLGRPLQIGRTRVEGIEVMAVGQLNNFWQVSAGLTKMESKALEQQNATGVDTVGVRFTPDLSATLWSSYTLGDFTVGGGARYVSEQERTITVVVGPQTGMSEIPSYWAADVMMAYRMSNQLNLRLNVYNLTDEEYIESLNNSGNRVRLGTPLSAMLTAEFVF